MGEYLFFGFIPATVLLWSIVIGFPLVTLSYFLIQDAISAKKSLILYFQAEKIVELVEKKVEDGMLNIGKRRFYVDEDEPASIQTGFLIKSWRPLHILKWNMAVPQKFTKEGTTVMTPTNMENFLSNKALDQLLTPKSDSAAPFLFLIVGVVMGALVGYFISNAHLIK